MTIEILHLSSVVKSPLVDKDGDRLGRVEDLIVRLGDAPHPEVAGVVVRIGNRELWIPIEKIEKIRPGLVRFVGDRVSLQRFERRPGELLLARDLKARHLINLQGARLIRANEIELATKDGRWEVVGVDPSTRAALRRLLPKGVGRRIKAGTIVDWESIEPFVAHVPTARLRIPYRKLSKLHPAQIADLVEAASHDEGEEIIEAVGQDRELEADVFEELDAEHQLEFIRSRSDSEAARLLATMAPDEAADLLTELDQDRRLPVLELLPLNKQRKVRSLLSYNSETAGGLMSPDFLCVADTMSVADVLDAVRA
ncbi:MAG TPA: PRC-barrel domain-containing protein, partial [Acidimicrobiales bacterium]|nr:PRC-barrel domain-containing protein [Acidimicrobiales bacterium]